MKNFGYNLAANDFSFAARLILTALYCIGVYLLIAAHFLLATGTAHFLGDPTYIPPSILRYTAVFFQSAEISAFIEITFLIVWLAFLAAICWAMFWTASKINNLICAAFPVIRQTASNCRKTAFVALLPLLILSLLTLSITPLQSPKYDAPSMSEIAEHLSFSKFLAAMDEATMAMFGVALFVLITLVTTVFVTKFLPDSPPMFFIAIFVGVIVGVAVLMPLLSFGAKGLESVQIHAGNSTLAHFALFAIYALVSAVFVLPAVWKRKTYK